MSPLPNVPVPLKHAELLAAALAEKWADDREDDRTP